jgi:hypothetical protein
MLPLSRARLAAALSLSLLLVLGPACSGGGGDGTPAADAASEPDVGAAPDAAPDDGFTPPDGADEDTVTPPDTAPDDALAPPDVAADAGPDAGPDPDACAPRRLGPGEVRARRVACAEELIGGPKAIGRVGDFLLENARVRFIVRGGPEGHFLLGTTGGGLVDADLVRPDGEPGQDALHELATAPSFNVIVPERAEVVAHGADGEAVVAIAGAVRPMPLIAALLPGFPIDGEVIQEYVLAPDVDHLVVRTRVRVPEGHAASMFNPVDAIFFGGEVRRFVPGSGYEMPDAYAGPFLAAAGDAVSYGYFADRDLNVVTAGDVAVILGRPQNVLPGAEAVRERTFAVGGGDLAAISALVHAAHGTETAPVAGVVREGAGLPGAPVDVLVRNAAGKPQTLVRPGADGAFTVDLPLGAGSLVAFGAACGAGEPLAIDVPAEGLGGLTVTAPPSGWVAAAVRDGEGAGIPARVSLTPLAGTPGGRRHLLVPPGGGVFPVPPGRYAATVARGMEYEALFLDELVVAPGETASLDAELAHVVDTIGWIGAEFHIHSEYSTDSDVPLADRALGCAAEGLEFVVATDHDFATDYQPTIDALGLGDWLLATPGAEVSSLDAGHHNAWPLLRDLDLSGAGSTPWYGLPHADLVEAIQAEHPGAIVQTNHPRRKESDGLFEKIGYDPADGRAHRPPAELGFPPETDLSDLRMDAYEVFNSKSENKVAVQLADWFSLIGRGRRVCATAGSDSHGIDRWPGHPRNLIHVGADEPADFTAADVAAAVRALRVVVTTGPFLRAGLIDGAGAVSLPGDLVTDTDGEVALHVTVQAPTWVGVDTIEVYRDGALVETVPVAAPEDGTPPPVVRYEATHTYEATADAWFTVIVRGGPLPDLLTNNASFALTNPLYLDADGDGDWTPPIL